jgi:apolipoprotein N-acyltransferase
MNIIRGRNISVYLMPVITGILLWLSALPSSLWYLSFIAFIPLLFASDLAIKTGRPVLTFCFQLLITLIVFYAGAAYWILQTTYLVFLIGFLIVLPFILLLTPYIWLKKRESRYSAVYFISAWLVAELVQSYFQLGSPFYNLGNNLGKLPHIIQWYEFTGAAGGTLWILVVNFLLYALVKTLKSNSRHLVRRGVATLVILFGPVFVSLILFYSYHEKGPKTEVLIIHPGTDCSNVKYRINIYGLMDIYLKVMLPQLTPNTGYVVLPETAITNAGWVKDLDNNLVFDYYKAHTAAYPDLKLVTGAIVYESIPDVESIKGHKKIPGIRYSKNYNVWYYTYNSALLVQKNQPVQMRTKDGLVPYQEYAPYPTLLPRFSPVGIDFQFSAREKNSKVFTDENRMRTAAFICYELVYGRLFAQSARHGAQAFFVLLNEGWYSDPKVPEQFLQLSVIRAIENRRSIAHASNLGVSAFINQRGEIIQRIDRKTPGFLKQEILLNRNKTLEATAGNYMGFIAILTISLVIVNELIMKRRTKTNDNKKKS